ncbi:MAG: C40 family peptidase [Bacilli bacterium]
MRVLLKKSFITTLTCFSLMVGGTLGAGEVAASSDKADSIIASAKRYLGTPYSFGGKSSKGFDCSGFTSYVFEQNDVDLPRTSGSQYSVGENVSKSNLEPGDLVFFKTGSKGVSHVGIYVGGNTFIHSQNGKGVSVTSLNDPYYWGKRFVGAKRVL